MREKNNVGVASKNVNRDYLGIIHLASRVMENNLGEGGRERMEFFCGTEKQGKLCFRIIRTFKYVPRNNPGFFVVVELDAWSGNPPEEQQSGSVMFYSSGSQPRFDETPSPSKRVAN